ncbi:putative stigma-specific protein Stig1 [Helianthus annuus]|uniref:Stigma-specific protein Stig1 n=1 Tax=Helianthus annuus TaxID=4232 RepID=A0A251TQG9_HELAN|nr:putative stigma-specific protein Stig1 [Helianthus annuus]KAJ0531577.1 putative stigma-specific protein Stig1 [Helianthus annuus]KAJ0698412.1 putative stigma-specific protein Stig1 [Helianthus annuus]KAJ0701762.1 putative stigma-specific protein Stig1 [Helianthus annuus]KAJ0881532.1 putative stigma-specific protein Stig1 [Helianthus annuus]
MNSTTQLFALNPFYQCDIYPRVCLAKGGVAPHCCKKKCVNVITDSLNCGSCGKKCKSGEACCKGRCVDVSTSRSNCGLCGMKCRYNESCCKGNCILIREIVGRVKTSAKRESLVPMGCAIMHEYWLIQFPHDDTMQITC